MKALFLLLAVVAVAAAADVPDVVAIRIAEPPEVDGQLEDAAWAAVARYHRGVLAGWRAGGKLQPQQRLGYVAYDDACLYIAMQAFTPDVFALEAGTGGVPFIGDCLEIHLRNPEGVYYQFGIDIDGNIGAGNVPPGADTGSVRGASDFGLNFWSTEVAIPWTTLATVPRDGLRLGFNLAANRAYQGEDRWVTLSWADRFGVSEDLKPSLELRIVDLETKPATAKPAAPPRTFAATAVHVAAPPAVDGELSDAVWQDHPAPLAGWSRMQADHPAVTHARTAWLAWDADNLYVALRVRGTDPDLLVSRDDRPELGDSLRVDFAGAATGIDFAGNNTRIVLPYILPIQAATAFTDDGWTAEMAIPWAETGGRPAANTPIPFNVAGHDSSEGPVTWAPVLDGRDTRHFGTLQIKE